VAPTRYSTNTVYVCCSDVMFLTCFVVKSVLSWCGILWSHRAASHMTARTLTSTSRYVVFTGINFPWHLTYSSHHLPQQLSTW